MSMILMSKLRGAGWVRALVVVIALAAAAGIIAYSISAKPKTDNSQSSQQQSSQPGWLIYRNAQYGFEFSYPAVWGNPSLTVRTPSHKGPNIKSQTGNYYQIVFPQVTSAVISMNFSSADYMAESCNSQGQCANDSGITDTAIKAALQNSQKNNFLSHDTDSYASMFYAGPGEPVTGVSINKLISLPKVNVKAVSATYTLLKPGVSCPTNNLSASPTPNCVTQSDYENLSQMAKSLSPV